MRFDPLPTIDLMADLYEKPRTIERFQEYLKALQGDTKSDLAMPIVGYNPMAREHALHKLIELKQIDAEGLIAQTLAELNDKLQADPRPHTFKVALNLSDDLKGGWTNRYTTDYNNKFGMQALVSRGFCAPVFWASEHYTPELIKRRTLEYAYRTMRWLTFPQPVTLREHIEQERSVAEKAGSTMQPQPDFDLLDKFCHKHWNSDDYHLIFNFFYGDEASQSLAFPTFGINKMFLCI